MRDWRRSEQVDVIFALTLPLILLVSPLGWLYYFPFLFLGVLIVWRLSAELDSKLAWRAALLGALAVTAIPRVLESARSMNSAYLWFFGGAVYNYALLTVLIVSVGVIWQVSRRRGCVNKPFDSQQMAGAV